MVYESEIPKELIEGEVYTSKDISYFISFARWVTVVCDDTNSFSETDKIKYKVDRKLEAYVIQNINGTTNIKNTKDTIYIIKRVY